MTTLDDLNGLVTKAILDAERLPTGSVEAVEAYHRVSLHEEAIARLTAPASADGMAARLGAVTAALRAGEALRALALASVYVADPLPLRAEEDLRRLIAMADGALIAGAADPLVKPVTFELASAA